MLQTAYALPAPKVIDLAPGTRDADQVRADLENMLAALARHHGEGKALMLLTEGFAGTFAQAARRGGSPIAWHYAATVELQNAFIRLANAPATPPSGPVAA